jgi:hypothetical protein
LASVNGRCGWTNTRITTYLELVQEREKESQRAERLAEQLRALGVKPVE